MTATTPHHRWFQFRLRTLLVGVVLTGTAFGWLGWQLKTVHDRKAILAEVESLGGGYSSRIPMAFEAGDPCWLRCMLGDVPTHFSFTVPPETEPATIRRIKSAFPEGVVMAVELKNGELRTIVFDKNGDKH